MRKVINKKNQRKSLMLFLTSSLLIGNSFASSTKVLDVDPLSNRISSILQDKNAKPLTTEEIKKASPSEYFVTIAVKMIFESLRLQEMGNHNPVDATTALKEGHDMFALGIGVFSNNVPVTKPSDRMKPDPEKPIIPTKKTELDKNQEEANRQAADILAEQQLQQQKQPDIQKDPPKNDLQPISQPKNENPSEKYKTKRLDYNTNKLTEDQVDNAKKNFGGKNLAGLNVGEIETYLTLRLNKDYANDLTEAERKKDYQSSSPLPPPPPTGLTNLPPPPPKIDLPPTPVNLPPPPVNLPPPPPPIGSPNGFASAPSAIKGCEHVDEGNLVPCQNCLEERLANINIQTPVLPNLLPLPNGILPSFSLGNDLPTDKKAALNLVVTKEELEKFETYIKDKENKERIQNRFNSVTNPRKKTIFALLFNPIYAEAKKILNGIVSESDFDDDLKQKNEGQAQPQPQNINDATQPDKTTSMKDDLKNQLNGGVGVKKTITEETVTVKKEGPYICLTHHKPVSIDDEAGAEYCKIGACRFQMANAKTSMGGGVKQ